MDRIEIVHGWIRHWHPSYRGSARRQPRT